MKRGTSSADLLGVGGCEDSQPPEDTQLPCGDSQQAESPEGGGDSHQLPPLPEDPQQPPVSLHPLPEDPQQLPHQPPAGATSSQLLVPLSFVLAAGVPPPPPSVTIDAATIAPPPHIDELLGPGATAVLGANYRVVGWQATTRVSTQLPKKSCAKKIKLDLTL